MEGLFLNRDYYFCADILKDLTEALSRAYALYPQVHIVPFAKIVIALENYLLRNMQLQLFHIKYFQKKGVYHKFYKNLESELKAKKLYIKIQF